MENDNKQQTTAQVCSIRIMFPVITDEQAIEYKKKVSSVLADISQARIEFSLMSRPPLLPDGS